MPLAGACEAAPLGAVYHIPITRDLLRARDRRLPTIQVLRRWRQNFTRTVIPVLPCIFCRGPEGDKAHGSTLCQRDQAAARVLCAKVEKFTTGLPLADRPLEFMSLKQH